MGANIPKQYLPLKDTTVIQQTLSKLYQIPQFEKIVLCLSEADQWWQALDTKMPDGQLPRPNLLTVVSGGKERCDSVLNGLNYLSDKADKHDWVLVHDVARPCVRVADIQNLIATVSDHSIGGLLGMPVRDTMKRAQATSSIRCGVA